MPNQQSDEEALFATILHNVPQFLPRYEEHISDNDELLPYVLMNDFSRFLMEVREDAPLFRTIVELLNRLYQEGNENVRLLLHSTFSETIAVIQDKELHARVWELLSPDLQESVRRFPGRTR